jgi:hypothetical protein
MGVFILKQKKITIAGVDVSVKFKDVVEKWNSERNAYTVTLKNEEGKKCSYTFYDSVHNTQNEIYITDDLISGILETLATDFYIDENNYPFFEDFQREFGYDNDREGRKVYKDCLKLSAKLQSVVDSEWVDSLKIVNVMTS